MGYTQNNRRRRQQNQEHVLQTHCISWTEWQSLNWPELEMYYAIPNGGYRPGRGGATMKSEGVKDGMPDLHFPLARRGYNSLYVELKKPTGRVTVRKNQIKRMTDLMFHNNLCYVLRTLTDFCDLSTWYLGYNEGQDFIYELPTVEKKFWFSGRFVQAELPY